MVGDEEGPFVDRRGQIGVVGDGGFAGWAWLAGQVELPLEVSGPGDLVERPASSPRGPACPGLSDSRALKMLEVKTYPSGLANRFLLGAGTTVPVEEAEEAEEAEEESSSRPSGNSAMEPLSSSSSSSSSLNTSALAKAFFFLAQAFCRSLMVMSEVLLCLSSLSAPSFPASTSPGSLAGVEPPPLVLAWQSCGDIKQASANV